MLDRLATAIDAGPMHLDERSLPDLARGCALLASGASGDLGLGLTMALRAVTAHGPVAVRTVAELADEELVLPCGLVGSPAVAAERIPSGDEGRALRDTVERRLGLRVAALMPYAIGGLNGLIAVTWAARLRLPLVDADGMGRTFPSLAQLSMVEAGVPVTPAVLADGRGNTLVLEAADDRWAARLASGAATAMGGLCAIAPAALTGRQARRAVIQGSVSQALRYGRAAREGGAGEVLHDGRVQEVRREVIDGAVHGSATVAGSGAFAGRRLRIELQSEFLLAIEDGRVRAAVPDIIAVLSQRSGEPMAAEDLHEGQQIRVVAFTAPQRWRRDSGLALTGPAAFGLEVPYSAIVREPAGVPA
jgi:hypothetical protein